MRFSLSRHYTHTPRVVYFPFGMPRWRVADPDTADGTSNFFAVGGNNSNTKKDNRFPRKQLLFLVITWTVTLLGKGEYNSRRSLQPLGVAFWSCIAPSSGFFFILSYTFQTFSDSWNKVVFGSLSSPFHNYIYMYVCVRVCVYIESFNIISEVSLIPIIHPFPSPFDNTYS